jgi:hypothetical protein
MNQFTPLETVSMEFAKSVAQCEEIGIELCDITEDLQTVKTTRYNIMQQIEKCIDTTETSELTELLHKVEKYLIMEYYLIHKNKLSTLENSYDSESFEVERHTYNTNMRNLGSISMRILRRE